MVFLKVASDFLSEFITTMSENESRPLTGQVFRPSAQVVIEAFENGALVLRLANQHLIELNPIASAILAKSDGQHSVTQVAAALAKACEIPETEVRQDVIALYKQFLTQEIVESIPLMEKDTFGIDPISQDKTFFIQNPVIVSHMDDESGMLYNPHTNQFKFVNFTGILCWKLCDGTHDLASITAVLQQSMKDAPADTIIADVREFISDLLKVDFVRTTTLAPGRG